MFVFYAVLVSLGFVAIDLLFEKAFQLENYKIKKYIKNVSKFNFSFGDKSFLVFTARAKRLIFCDFLLKISTFLLIFGIINSFLWNLFATLFLLIFSPCFVVLTFLICWPIEEAIKKSYLKKAKRKLAKCMCKKIAITGSFGKTSTKNILYQILKEEFDVCATPKSFNTPMGICKTILQDLKETDDFFIAEFGARRLGDIKFLAEFLEVDFGIITPVGNCHLETFGSLQNIENEKFELCNHAKDFVVFNGKSKSSKKLCQRYKKTKYLVCEKNSFAYAKEIANFADITKFVLVIDKNEMACSTKLLGKVNIDNIVVAATMAYLLGESLFSIKRGIEKLAQIPHRLEFLDGEFVDVIDDSYNSNFEGFMQALEVLDGFAKRKVVVSPGLVELGFMQKENNFKIGQEIAKVADVFVIMNQTNKKALFDGAVSQGMKKENICFAQNRKEQKEVLKTILQKGDIVLFENDFPDNIK